MVRLVLLAGLMTVFSPGHSFELNPAYFMPQKILQSICNTLCIARSRNLFPQIQEMSNKTSNIFCGMCLMKNNTTSSEPPSRPTVTKPAAWTPSRPTVTKPAASTPSRPAVTKPPASTPSVGTTVPPTSTSSDRIASPGTSTASENEEKQEETGTTISP